MSPSHPPKSRRRSIAPELPEGLGAALETVRRAPLDLEAWDALEEVTRKLERPEEAAALYEEVLANQEPSPELVEIGRRAADYCEEWFEDPEPTIRKLARVLELDPSQGWAFDRLTVLLTASSRWEELLGVYDRAIERAASEGERANLLGEAARVARDFAGEAQRGSDYQKALLLLRPRDDQLAASLERRLDEQGRHLDLIEVWRARVLVLEVGASLKTRLAIAARFFDALNDAGSAFSAILEFLDAGGRRLEAVELLERLSRSPAAPLDVRRSALTLLDAEYTELGRLAELVAVSELSLELADSDEARVTQRQKAARLLEELGRTEEALEHAAELLVLDPSLEDAQAQAERLGRFIGGLDVYVNALVRAADVTESTPRRVALLLEAAGLLEGELGDEGRAVELFSRVLGDAESDAASRRTAARALSALLERRGPPEQRLTVLERRAELEDTLEEKKTVLGDAARLADSLGDPDKALSLWAARLASDASDLEALGARVTLLERLGRYQGLVDVLVDRAHVRPDPADKRADLVWAARVYSEDLGDLPQAIRTWREIEGEFGRTSESLDRLVELSERAERHDDVIGLLREAVSDEPDLERRVVHRSRLGDTFRLHLGRYAEAVAEYRAALEIDPSSAKAREGLRALLVSEEHGEAAAETLAWAFRVADEPRALLELLETRLLLARGDAERHRILLEAAELEERAGDFDAALRATCRAFAIGLDVEVEGRAHRLAETTGDFVALVTAYQKALERAGGARAIELHFAQGRVWEERLARPAGASASYKEALSLDPSRLDVAVALVRAAMVAELFGEAAWAFVEHAAATSALAPELERAFEQGASDRGQWDEPLEAFAAAIAKKTTLEPRLVHDLKRRLALWHRDFQGDADAAELVLRRAVTDYPEEGTLRMLAELERRAPGRPLVRTLETLADVTGDDLSVLREASEVALSILADVELARPLLERTWRVSSERFLGQEPPDVGFLEAEVSLWSLERLVEIAREAGELELSVSLLERGARLPFEGGVRVELGLRAASLAEGLPEDTKAVALSAWVLELEPTHERAIELLSGLHERAGRLAELLELRQRELELERPLERRLFLRLDQARVLGQLDGDVEARLAALTRNLEEVPGHDPTLRAMVELLLELGRVQETVSLLEEQAQLESRAHPERAASLFEQAGRLAEERLADVGRTHQDFKAAAALHATIPVLERLAAIARERSETEAEIDWLQKRLELTPTGGDPEIISDRRQTVERLAQALLAGDEGSRARGLLEAELAADPGANALRTLLAQRYTEGEDYQELARLLVEGVRYAATDEERVELLRSAAQVTRRRLGDVTGAIPLLERAIQLAPEERTLRLSLADALRIAGHLDPARVLLLGLLEEFGRRRTKERALVHLQLARIAQASGDLDGALEQAEAAVKIERTDAVMLMLVGRLAREKGQLEQAEQAYRTLLLIVSRGARPVGASDEEEQVGESSILFELSRIAEEEGQKDRARELLESALEVATQDPEEALRLEAELTAAGQADLLLAALDDRLRGGAEGAAAARLWVTKAQVLSKNERHEEAFAARLAALDFAPDDARLLDGTWKVAEQYERLPELTARLEHIARASATSPEVSGDLWFRLGAEAEARDVDAAISFYESAQLTGHRPRRTFAALDRLLSERGDAPRLTQALERYVAAPAAAKNPEAWADAHYRLAELDLVSGSSTRALERFERALELDPKPARVLDVLAERSRAGLLDTELLPLFVRVARLVADNALLLEALDAASDLPEAAADDVAEAIELARRAGERRVLARLLSRFIALRRQAGELASAREALVERASLAAEDTELSLAAALLEEALAFYEGDELFELERRRAELLREAGTDTAQALAAYESLFERAPYDRRIWLPLLALYRQLGRLAELEGVIERVEAGAPSAEERELLRMEKVRVVLDSGRFEEAERVLVAALEERADFTEAADILADLLRDQGRHQELRELWEKLFDAARSRDDAAQVTRYVLLLARLLADTEPQEAISLLVASLTWTRGERDVLVLLSSLYGDEADPSDRAEVLEYLLAIEEAPRAVELALELSSLREQLGDRYGSGRALELGFQKAPVDERLGAAFAQFLESEEEYARLAEVLSERAERQEDPTVAARLFSEAARALEDRLGDPSAAASAYLRAFEKEPEEPGYLDKAIWLLVSIGEGEAALGHLARAIEIADEMSLADLLQLRARVIARELSADAELVRLGADDLKRALGLFVSEEQAAEIQAERVEFLLKLQSLASAAEDEDAEREVVLELGRLEAGRGNPRQAAETLQSWLESHPFDLELARELAELALAHDVSDVALFSTRILFEQGQGEERANAALAYADAAERAGRPMDAKEVLLEALRENPGRGEFAARLRRMYEQAGAHLELGELLLEEAELASDPAQRFRLLQDAGELFLKAQNGERAAATLERAREIAPDPYGITAQLADCYVEMGEVARARQILDESVEAHGKRRSPELSVLQHALARVARVSGDVEGMYAWLEAALMSDRNNSEVAVELARRGQEDGRYDVAVKALQLITLGKAPASMSKAEAYFRQAQIAEYQGDPKKALLLGRRALSTEDGFPEAESFVARLGG